MLTASKITPGMKFGRLTIIKEFGRRPSDGAILWNCLCDCGKETNTSSVELRSGKSKSCGCYREERRISALRSPEVRKKNGQRRKEGWPKAKKSFGMIESTNLSYMENAKVRSDNKTGVRGVTIEKGKFVAKIRFNGVRYYLGTFSSLELARKARELAEEELKPEIERLKAELERTNDEGAGGPK